MAKINSIGYRGIVADLPGSKEAIGLGSITQFQDSGTINAIERITLLGYYGGNAWAATQATADLPIETILLSPQAPTALRSLIANIPTSV